VWDIEMPEDNESASGDSGKLTRAKLISSELEGKLKAISGYDDMLWKIRSGYVAILYGIPAIFLGTEGVPNLKELMADSGRALFILLLLGGFQPIGFHHRQQLSCEETESHRHQGFARQERLRCRRQPSSLR
jgi:hypothetical protein